MPKKITFLLILLVATISGSCFFRNVEEMTADADKEISQSAALQNLEKLCLSMPFFSGIKPDEKMVTRSRLVSYKYRLSLDFSDLKAAYKNKFLAEGWTLAEEKRVVADEIIIFRKGKLEFYINKSLLDEVAYSVGCKDYSITN